MDTIKISQIIVTKLPGQQIDDATDESIKLCIKHRCDVKLIPYVGADKAYIVSYKSILQSITNQDN